LHEIGRAGMFPVHYAEAVIVQQEYGEIADNSGGEKRTYRKGVTIAPPTPRLENGSDFGCTWAVACVRSRGETGYVTCLSKQTCASLKSWNGGSANAVKWMSL
jgi:hypothetical protein